MAQPGLLQSLNDPAFPAQIDAKDRHFGWFALTVIAGLGAAVMAALAIGILASVIFAAGMTASGHADTLAALLRRFAYLMENPRTTLTYADSLSVMILLGVVNTPAFIAPVLLAGVIGRRAIRLYFTAFPKIRWAQIGWAMLIMGVVLLPIFAISEVIQPTPGDPGIPVLTLTQDAGLRITFMLVSLFCLLPAAAAEEILFRGWLLRQSMAFVRSPWIAFAVNGVLFAAMHMNPNLDDSFQLAMMGVAFCYMAFRFGGIEFAIGAHAINNLLIVWFFSPLPLANDTHPFSWTTVAAGFLVPAACVIVTEVVLRWEPLRRLVGAEAPPPTTLATSEAFS